MLARHAAADEVRKGTTVAKKTPRPGRTLLVFAICVGVLYGLAALGGTWKPRLGLDLEGGTRITLVAKNKHVSPTKLKQAADIIDSRVNGSGVSEAAVSTQGSSNIIVEIPGKNRSDLVDTAKRTAQLRFRLVAVGSPQPSQPQPSVSGSSSPSTTASPSPGTKASTSPSTKAKPSGTATPKPRPAPAFAPVAKKPKKTASATPLAQPSATPTAAQGASPDKPMAWAQNPGTPWLLKLAQFNCPPQGADAREVAADDPSKPLITCDSSGNKFLLSKAIIEGTQLKTASYGTPQNGIGWAVNLSFKSSARKTFGTTTTQLNQNGGSFAIVLDGQVISAAGVNEPILDGNAQITGSFTETEARSLANSLKYGALPIKFTRPTVETIGPSLAGDQLSAGVLAGIIGLLIVMIYCLLYYRGLGIVVIASLVVAGVITYAIVLVLAKAAGFTLTLPGIAGLIVAVGITSDSFIVYFERIRDEMRDGKSMRVAVEAGWKRARHTCLAADGVSFLAAIVLYIFAIGVVRGFAFALGISTIIDVVVFFFFTKPVMTTFARRSFFNSGGRLSGLSAETLGIDDDPRLAGGRA
jgi:preprotein translocase subunit SecD